MATQALADELNMEEVNSQLAQVQGLGFALPEGATKHGNAPSAALDPKSFQVEETNELLFQITGGVLGESANAPKKTVATPARKPLIENEYPEPYEDQFLVDQHLYRELGDAYSKFGNLMMKALTHSHNHGPEAKKALNTLGAVWKKLQGQMDELYVNLGNNVEESKQKPVG